MKKISALIILFTASFQLFAQSGKLEIKDLGPAYKDYKFPEIKYPANPKVEEKINTFLQYENLEIVPNHYKVHPFEKICRTEEKWDNVMFYDWKRIKTPKNILCLQLSGSATAMHSDEFERIYIFDIQSGNPIDIHDFITLRGLMELAKIMNERKKKIITKHLLELREQFKNNPQWREEIKDHTNNEIEMYESCMNSNDSNDLEYFSYYFHNDSITFIGGDCSFRAGRDLASLGRFDNTFSYSEIEPYLFDYGKAMLHGKDYEFESDSPEGKIYKGTINDKYPITAIIHSIYPEGDVVMEYWYDKVKIPISLDGKFEKDHFSLVENDYYSEELQRWIPRAYIEVIWINKEKIYGTWRNYKTGEELPFEIYVY